MRAEGKATHVEFAGKFDGKDYTITGDPDVDKIVLKKIDANGWDEVLKKSWKGNSERTKRCLQRRQDDDSHLEV